MKITLKHHAINEARISIGNLPSGSLSLEAPMSFNIDYRKDNKEFVVRYKQDIRTKDIVGIDIMVNMFAVFDASGIKTDNDKINAHKEAYDILFSFMQEAISDFMTKAALAPIQLKKIELNDTNIILQQ